MISYGYLINARVSPTSVIAIPVEPKRTGVSRDFRFVHHTQLDAAATKTAQRATIHKLL
jgi:hypothetical protein